MSAHKQKLESLTGGSGVHVFLVLWKAARAAQAYAEKSILKLEMCGSDFAVLEALLHKGPLPVNEIGKKVLLTSGSITVAVDRLETKGLVERRAHGTDRRARVVHLTKEGRKLITRAYADHAADMERIGLGQWFRYVTGSLEVLGAVLLLIPRLSGLGALLLVGVMLGAVPTHLFVVGGNPLPAIILLIVTGVVAWGRRKRTMNLLAEIR